MDLQTVGSTDLVVSPIGLGLVALGRPGYPNLGHADDLDATYEVSSMQARAHQMLDAAYAAGLIVIVDTVLTAYAMESTNQ
jgi:aryl-alcohol dehydrogenase-like predicted oxidoreductase